MVIRIAIAGKAHGLALVLGGGAGGAMHEDQRQNALFVDIGHFRATRPGHAI